MPGNYDDRREVTYYLPTPEDIALANELFPGQGAAPPWLLVYNKLQSHLPLGEVYRLKCFEALVLFRWSVFCERWQERHWLQQNLANVVQTLEQIQRCQEQILVNFAWVIWSATQQQKIAVTVHPANPATCSESEAMLKRLLEECQRRKQAEVDKVAAERIETDALPTLRQAATENRSTTAASQPIEISPPDKATSQQSEVAGSSASQQGPPETQPATTEPTDPADWLLSWRAIHDTLRVEKLWPNTTYQERRKRLRRLNEIWEGPIKIGPKGRQPKVSRSKLLEWWNQLGEKVESEKAKQQDAAATVAAQYLYGRGSSVVCPDICGSVKR